MRALVGLGMAMALLASQAVAQPAWAQAQSPALIGKVVSDPEGPMDETTFRWIMNEDAMASEKLAEGIRVFAHDLKTLRRRIAKRLQ